MEEKIRYGNILRSQLTTFEVGLAGLNGLTKMANDFKSLIEEYRLLKYISNGRIKAELRKHYSENAFKGRSEHTDNAEEAVLDDNFDEIAS